jgi:hypothetical protein
MGTINEAMSKVGIDKERPCNDCKDRPNYFKDKPCWTCGGTLKVAVPDFDKIVEDIKGRGGKLRSKRPQDKRSYYVWRLARFHGGIDVTMPMCAAFDLAYDPYRKELDEMAEAVARKTCGTDMAAAAAAYRWGQALGFAPSAPEGLPITAYPGGPDVIAPKPFEERLELQ